MLYFYPAHSNDWNDQLNWFTDYNHTQHASSLPSSSSTTYILGDILSNSGGSINVYKFVLIDSTLGTGVIVGAAIAELRGNSKNNGTINSSSTQYNTKLALNFQGALNSSVFSDSSSYNHTLINSGSTSIVSTQYTVGSTSGYFPGNSYLSVSDGGEFTPDYNTQPITVEAWVYATQSRPGCAIVSAKYNNSGGSTPIPFSLCLNDGNGGCTNSSIPCFGIYNGNWTMAVADANLPLNQWVHLAGTYDGKNLNIYVNGVKKGSAALTIIPTYNTGTIYIGRRWNDSCGSNNYFNGYINQVKIVKGTALYIDNFTPSNSLAGNTTTAPGNCYIYDSSQNAGNINSRAVLYDHSFNTGTLGAGGDVYYPSVGSIQTGTATGVSYHMVDPRALYFNAATDHEWNNINNWWKNPTCTIQASSLPGSTNTVYINTSVNSITGSLASFSRAIFTNANLASGLTIRGNVELRGNSINNGTIGVLTPNTGKVKLLDRSVNAGSISEAVEIFDYATNTGTISGTVTSYTSGARFLYFNGAVNNNWNSLGNWWLDIDHTASASALPTYGTRCELLADITSNSGSSAVCRSIKIGTGRTLSGFTIAADDYLYFYTDGSNGCTVTTNAIFRDSAKNYNGTLSGENLFLDTSYNASGGTCSSISTTIFPTAASYNLGTINGAAILYPGVLGIYTLAGTQVWHAGTYNGAILGGDGTSITKWLFTEYSTTDPQAKIYGAAELRDNSNIGYYSIIYGDTTLRNNSYTYYAKINGNLTCYDNSYARGDQYDSLYCTGNAIFNNNSYNFGITVRGNAIFNDNAYNSGIINGTTTLNGASYSAGSVSEYRYSELKGATYFNTTYYSGGSVPTGGIITVNGNIPFAANATGQIYDSNNSLVTKIAFNGTTHLSISLTAANTDLEFNNSAYIDQNVSVVAKNITFNNSSYIRYGGNDYLTGNVICNDQAYLSANILSNSGNTNTAIFNGISQFAGTLYIPATFNDNSWSSGNLYATTTVTRATGGVLTLTNGQNWQGLYGVYSDNYLNPTSRHNYLFKGGDGQTITKIVYTGGATQTSGYNYNPPTLYINAEFHGAAINYATIVGNVDFYDTSQNAAYNSAAIINGTVTFHDYSQNNALVYIDQSVNQYAASAGTISFRDYSKNNSLVGENRYGYSTITDAYFYDSAWNYGTVTGVSYYQGIVNGIWTLPRNFDLTYQPVLGSKVRSNDSVPVNTFVFSGTGKNQTTLTVNAVFNDTGGNNGTVNGNAVFNGYTTFDYGTVHGRVTYTVAQNGQYIINGSTQWLNTDNSYTGIFCGDGTPLTTWVFNTGQFNLGSIPGNAIFNGNSYNAANDVYYHINGINRISLNPRVLGTAIFNDTSYNNNIVSYGVFNNSAYNLRTVNNDAVFNDNSYNSGTVSNNATFNNNSYNSGNINHNATFSSNTAIVTSSSVIYGTATFSYSVNGLTDWKINNDFIGDWRGNFLNTDGSPTTIVLSGTSKNTTVIRGNAKFIDYSTNKGTVTGDAEFDNYSINGQNGVVNNNAIFRDYSSTININSAILGNAYVYYLLDPTSTTGNTGNYPLNEYVAGTIYYYGNPPIYNNATGDGDWNNLNNWWTSVTLNQNLLNIPSINDTVVIAGDITQNTGTPIDVLRIYVNATSQTINLGVDITTTNNSYINSIIGYGYDDYGNFITTVFIATINSNFSAPTVLLYGGAINAGTITGNAILHTYSTNTGTITGNADVYSPGTRPIGGTVNGETNYYNFTDAPYSFSLTNLNQFFAVMVAIKPIELSISGPPLLSYTYTLEHIAYRKVATDWFNLDYNSNTFTGTVPPGGEGSYTLTITATADVPYYHNYTFSQTYGFESIVGIDIYPKSLNFTLTTPPTALSPINLQNRGITPITYLRFSLSEGISQSAILPTISLNWPDSTITGSPQLSADYPLNISTGVYDYIYVDVYVRGIPGDSNAYFYTLQLAPVTTNIDINFNVPNRLFGILNGVSRNISIPVPYTGPVTGLAIAGLPPGLNMVEDNNNYTITGVINLPNFTQSSHIDYYIRLTATDGYYTDLYYDFVISTTPIYIFPFQSINFVGRSCLVSKVTVSDINTSDYTWNDPINPPPGISFNKTSGTFYGLATQQGSGTTTVSLTTVTGVTLTATMSWHVVFLPTSLAGGIIYIDRYTNVNKQIDYTGDPPDVWSYTGDTLPVGLVFDTATGAIKGNTTGQPGEYYITVNTQEPGGLYPTSADYTLVILPGTTYLRPSATLTVYVGSTVDYSIPYTGTPPDSWGISSGNLGSLVLDTALGKITGIATFTPSVSVVTVYAMTGGSPSGIYTVITINVIYSPTVITVGQSFTGSRNSTVAFQVLYTGAAVISWTALGLPAGLNINKDTGLISGTPSEIGVFNPTINVTALGGLSTGNIAINIAEILPIITPNQTFTFIAGAAITSNNLVKTTGGIPTSWTIVSTSDIPLITIDNSGAISGTAPALIGQYSTTVTASNSAGSAVATIIHINVIVALPEISPEQYIITAANANFSLAVQYTGGQPASWSISYNPYGVTIDNTGLISGVITSVGVFNYTVTATNSSGSSSKSITINVAGVAPTIIRNQTIKLLIGSTVSTAISYTGNATTWALDTGSSLPSGISLDPSTGYITGTPVLPLGTTSAVIVVSNSYGYTKGSVSFNVYSVINQNQTFLGYRNTAASFSLVLTGGTIYNATIIGGVLPMGMTINSSGKISGTPSEIGVFPVTVQAQTAQYYNTATVTITINESIPKITSNQKISLPLGSAIPPGKAILSYGGLVTSWAQLPINGASNISLNPVTGEYQGTTPSSAGDYYSYVTATNSVGSSDQMLITLSVIDMSPVITPNQSITVGGYSNISYQVQYSGGTPLSWNIINAPREISIDGTGRITGYMKVVGAFSYNVTATNTGGTSSVPINIIVPGISPIIAQNQSISCQLGTPLSYNISYTGNATSWAVTGNTPLPTGLTINSSTGNINGTPSGNAGVYTVTISATNSYGTTYQSIKITVVEVPPYIINGQIISGITYGAVDFTPAYSGGTPSSWSATGLPDGLNIDNSTGRITGSVSVPTNTAALINASNTGGSSNQQLTIKIASGAPSLDTNQVFVFTSGIYKTIQPTYKGAIPYVWTITNLPDGLSYSSITGAIYGATTTTGSFTITISLESLLYDPVSGTILLSVVTSNAKLSIDQGQTIFGTTNASVSFNPTYIGSPVLWYSDSIPSWLTLNPTTGRISGTPTNTQNATFCLFAKDINNYTTSAFINININ